MSVKHFKEYYQKVVEQYTDMKSELEDFKALADEGHFPMEKIEDVKKMIEPLMNNYETLSYIAFLLNMPNRESKKEKYVKTNKKKIKDIQYKNTECGVIETNDGVIKSLYDKNNIHQ